VGYVVAENIQRMFDTVHLFEAVYSDTSVNE